MIRFGDISINRKLTFIILSVSGITLMLACMAFIIYDRISFKNSMVQNLESVARMVGTNSAAALVFDDDSDAREMLKSLTTQRYINHAIIYRKDGRILAGYHCTGCDSSFVPSNIRNNGHQFDKDVLELVHAIVLDGQVIGTLYLQANLDELHRRLSRFSLVAAVFVLMAFIPAFFIASGLQRFISQPIMHLAEKARIVSENKDYSIRAVKESNDEMGVLIDSFNEMLGQIQERDAQLQNTQWILKDRGKKLEMELAERKRTEEALKFTQFSIDHAAVAAFHMDSSGNFVYNNEAACHYLGYSSDELSAMCIFDIDLSLADGEQSEYWKKAAEQKKLIFESLHRGKDNRLVPVEVSVNHIEFGGNKYICAFARDLTEHKKAETQRRELQEKLERAERMESIGVLAGGVAHDLNNMLGPLVGYPELILMKLPPDSPVRKQVERIGRSAQEAADVIQDLLTLARRGRYEMGRLNVNQVVEAYIDSPNFEGLTRENPRLKVEVNLDPDLTDIIGSAPHLSKVIMNLVVNAFEASPAGGQIVIETSHRQLNTLRSGYDKIEPGEYVLLSVRDSGSGISPQDRDKIFEPYYSRKKMGRSGSGLGLSIVYGIIKDHKGYYDLFSEVGKGTEFIIYLPVARSGKIETARPAGNYSGTESILVVDDVEEQREIAAALLASYGYEVTTVNNGRDAIAYLSNHQVDLVILDMIMENDFDGLDTYRAIIKMNPKQKAIIISGFSATERVNEMQQLGAGQYIKKPYSRENLGRAVRQELDSLPRLASVTG